MTTSALDLDRLLKLRLVVARFGEMDVTRWWNTKGQLGRLGAAALRRGFPRTHHFAQARSVFAVASQRCAEVFEPPRCVTLWRLSEEVEDEFDARWERFIDDAAAWAPFFDSIAALSGDSLVDSLVALGLVTTRDVEAFGALRRSSDVPAVALPNAFAGRDDDVALLALGFARGEPGALVVPYARQAD